MASSLYPTHPQSLLIAAAAAAAADQDTTSGTSTEHQQLQDESAHASPLKKSKGSKPTITLSPDGTLPSTPTTLRKRKRSLDAVLSINAGLISPVAISQSETIAEGDAEREVILEGESAQGSGNGNGVRNLNLSLLEEQKEGEEDVDAGKGREEDGSLLQTATGGGTDTQTLKANTVTVHKQEDTQEAIINEQGLSSQQPALSNSNAHLSIPAIPLRATGKGFPVEEKNTPPSPGKKPLQNTEGSPMKRRKWQLEMKKLEDEGDDTSKYAETSNQPSSADTASSEASGARRVLELFPSEKESNLLL